MSEGMKRFLEGLLNGTPGLLAICITDREGVTVMKVANQDAPDLCMRPNFLSTSGTTSEQASKLSLGKNKKSVVAFKSYQVVYFNLHPIFVTLIAKSTANTGFLLGMEDQLAPVIEQISKVVDNS